MYEEIDRLYGAEDEFADLLEAAFLSGQIDSPTQALAYLWLATNHLSIH